MNKFGAIACAILLVLTSVFSHASTPVRENPFRLTASDFLRLYPNGLYFEIQRNGQPIGFHKAFAQKNGKQLIIENHTTMKTRAFFNLIPYELNYQSSSTWENDRFVEYTADVLEQNKPLKISLKHQEGHSVLTVNDKQQKILNEIIPSPNWLSVYINGQGVLDGLTGEIENVSYLKAGIDFVAQSLEARRFEVISKNIEATEWYDEKSRWVAMSFEAPDGSNVRYVCVICGVEKKIKLSMNGDQSPFALE